MKINLNLSPRSLEIKDQKQGIIEWYKIHKIKSGFFKSYYPTSIEILQNKRGGLCNIKLYGGSHPAILDTKTNDACYPRLFDGLEVNEDLSKILIFYFLTWRLDISNTDRYNKYSSIVLEKEKVKGIWECFEENNEFYKFNVLNYSTIINKPKRI